jgi:hypothetical protein
VSLPPGLDSQAYSHNQHGDYYGYISPGSQYVPQGPFDYRQLSQPTHTDSMSANLQQHQLTDKMYTQDSQPQYSPLSCSYSPPSPSVLLHRSPRQATYNPDAAPSITVTPSTTADDNVKLDQVDIPSQNHHLYSSLPALSSPSDMSEPPGRRSPTLQNSSRVPGQRVDVDGKMLENSFRENDGQSRVRRHLLDDLQQQQWYHLDQEEPKLDVHLHRDILEQGLGMVGRSIYTVFLVNDEECNQWRCLFGSEEVSCKMTERRFWRVERAIDHVRIHLGHRPFACDGTCKEAKSTGITWLVEAPFYFAQFNSQPCSGKSFCGASFLQDHKNRPALQSKKTCRIWCVHFDILLHA